MENDLSTILHGAFSEAVISTFMKMLMIRLVPKDCSSIDAYPFELSAMIGYSGSINGMCVLRMSASTASEAIGRLTGVPVDDAADIADGAGELVNMIAGNAKAMISNTDISLSFPEVVRGKNHEVCFQRHSSLIRLAFGSEIGDVAVIVAFSQDSDKKRSPFYVAEGIK